jgi:hypothetical protein
MYVVAGPSGSGKTSAFPGERYGCDYFNADAYAAMLNGGSYLGIPKSIRKEVGPVCEKFIWTTSPQAWTSQQKPPCAVQSFSIK